MDRKGQSSVKEEEEDRLGGQGGKSWQKPQEEGKRAENSELMTKKYERKSACGEV